MPEPSFADLLAEKARKKAEGEVKAKADRERRKKEREARKALEAASGPVPSRPPPRTAPDPATVSRTERAYLHPAMKGARLHPDDIPVEVLRGLLYFFEGRVNWKMDKLEMRRELRRYLKYDENVAMLVDAIRAVAGE